MNSIDQLLLGGFVCALVFGAAAQASRFCPQGGLREAAAGVGAARLSAYFAAIGVALLGVALVQLRLGHALAPTHPPYLATRLAWGRYLLGGVVFGFGMALARACPLRATVRLAQGAAQALLLLIVMAAAAFAMSRTALYDDAVAPWLGTLTLDLGRWGWSGQGLADALHLSGVAPRAVLGMALGVAVLAVAARGLPWRGYRTEWIGAVLIGLSIAAGYALTAGPIGARAVDDAAFMDQPPDGLGVQSFSYAGPLSDVAHFVLHPRGQTFTLGIVMLLGTLVGALLSALARREFVVQALEPVPTLALRLVGAALTGFGAVLALGCTVGQGLSGIAVLSLGSVLATAGIFAGAWLALRVEALAQGGSA